MNQVFEVKTNINCMIRMKSCFQFISGLWFCIFFMSCNSKNSQIPAGAINGEEIIHENIEKLTAIIVQDVFSAPVASRIYVYASLAQYEAIRYIDSTHYGSIAEKLNGFSAIPRPEKNQQYNFHVSAVKAFSTMALHLIFLKDSLNAYTEKELAALAAATDKKVFERSLKLGDSIGNLIWERASKDNYKESRGYPRYMVNREEGKWKPTAPDYTDAAEPYWNTIKCLIMDSASEFKPAPPNNYSTEKESLFFKELSEVYNTVKNLNDSQKVIAQYWDDNPFTMNHTGHLSYSTKKITPGGHWLGITSIACKQKKLPQAKSAQAYALVSLALFEGFISCWDEKYRSNSVRPITAINSLIDPGWQSYLQTPPFPEYTSGHSVVSGAASTILNHLFGDKFEFNDTSEMEYIGLQRNFNSFDSAAKEAALSRLYGGIHYQRSIGMGLEQGGKVGAFIIGKLINQF